jgi:hypothetical protein
MSELRGKDVPKCCDIKNKIETIDVLDNEGHLLTVPKYLLKCCSKTCNLREQCGFQTFHETHKLITEN